MTTPQPLRIWTHGACNPHGGHGGWAYVIVQGAVVRGEAGGLRDSTPHRMAMTAVIKALEAVGAGPEAAMVVSSDPSIVAGAAPEPGQDTDLWRQLAVALTARPTKLGPAAARAEPKSAAGFVQAWSAFAVDKVKAGGPFRAPIPRPNLQKFPGLGGGS